LGKNEEKEEGKLAFSPAKKQQKSETKVSNRVVKNDETKSKVLQYAQVIDIEDPDKETVD
jgi:hypothetical protein